MAYCSTHSWSVTTVTMPCRPGLSLCFLSLYQCFSAVYALLVLSRTRRCCWWPLLLKDHRINLSFSSNLYWSYHFWCYWSFRYRYCHCHHLHLVWTGSPFGHHCLFKWSSFCLSYLLIIFCKSDAAWLLVSDFQCRWLAWYCPDYWSIDLHWRPREFFPELSLQFGNCSFALFMLHCCSCLDTRWRWLESTWFL